MNNLKSVWIESSYEIIDPDGTSVRHYWQCATLAASAIEIIQRRCGMEMGSLKEQPEGLKQHDENHYSCETTNRFGKKTLLEFHFDCEENPFPARDRQTVYDHREACYDFEKRKVVEYERDIPRPGLKKMPMVLNFGKK